MAQVVIALGSNLNDPHHQLQQALGFLSEISTQPIKKSSIYSSEPIGPSEFDFLNAVVLIATELTASELFRALKKQEQRQGRPSRYPKWTARPIDMDIIAYDEKIIKTSELTIPHAAYSQRLFVLLPLQEIFPHWVDPETTSAIENLIETAPSMSISKSNLAW